MDSLKPRFIIKNNFQKKPIKYSDILIPSILEDICIRVTGEREYECEFIDEGYNKGRMVLLLYKGITTVISLSELEASGRNSCFQSVPSALNSYYLDINNPKRMCYYFMPMEGSIKTPYFMFMYRLMVTAGIELINDTAYLGEKIIPYANVEDLINARNSNRNKNSSNNSTFVTLSTKRYPQIYGKTYGASKYETTLIAVALSRIASAPIELYEIQEQTLTELPARSLETIRRLGIHIFPTSVRLERYEYEVENSLRSPRYTYNLLNKFGRKKCAFCGCEIPELIQGAHVWPVANIKKIVNATEDEKLSYALDGDNGLWLCQNHHKLFDENIIVVGMNGELQFGTSLKQDDIDYIQYITPENCLDGEVMTPKFMFYLNQRNMSIASIH